MKWYPFDKNKGYRQKRPPINRMVLVLLPRNATKPGHPPSVAVGYRKDSAGCKGFPYFVISGIGGFPTHWCDCLGDDFKTPEVIDDVGTWQMKQPDEKGDVNG